MQNPLSIGVDIGGTHITCAVVKMQEGLLLEETLSRATYRHEDSADDIITSWAKALNKTLKQVDESQLAGIGFAIPGPFDYRNGISKMEHKFRSLYGLHIPTVLNPLLSTQKDVRMRFLNDATAFAVGEAWLGEGQGYKKVVVITLGTGFGAAFVENDVPVVSGATVPKEGCLWHLPFKQGIADDYFSTRWFVEEYKQRKGETITGVKDLMARAEVDGEAKSLFLQFGQNLAECLTSPLQNFGAEILIIGGNIAHALPYFGPEFREGLKKAGVSVKVLASRHMEHAALIGSARLLDDAYWDKVSVQLPKL